RPVAGGGADALEVREAGAHEGDLAVRADRHVQGRVVALGPQGAEQHTRRGPAQPAGRTEVAGESARGSAGGVGTVTDTRDEQRSRPGRRRGPPFGGDERRWVGLL